MSICLASLEAEKKRVDESDRKLSEAQEVTEENRKKLDDADQKILQLRETVNRLEEKLSNLESENQVLRQQAVSIAPTPNKILSGRSRSILQRGSDSGHFGDSHFRDLHSPSMNYREAEVEERPQKYLHLLHTGDFL